MPVIRALGLLRAPLVYLSLFFKRHREEYYRRLNFVRSEGDWEGWIDFFSRWRCHDRRRNRHLGAQLFNPVSTDRRPLLDVESTSVSAIRLFERLPRHPMVTVASAMKLLDTSKPTATRAIEVRPRSASSRTRQEREATAASPIDPTRSVCGPERSWESVEQQEARRGYPRPKSCSVG